jgi:hypothetical protein
MEEEEDDEPEPDRRKLDETIHYLNTLDDEKTNRLNTASEDPEDMQNILSTLKNEINEEETEQKNPQDIFIDPSQINLP